MSGGPGAPGKARRCWSRDSNLTRVLTKELVEGCIDADLFPTSEAMSGYVTSQVTEVKGGQLMP